MKVPRALVCTTDRTRPEGYSYPPEGMGIRMAETTKNDVLRGGSTVLHAEVSLTYCVKCSDEPVGIVARSRI